MAYYTGICIGGPQDGEFKTWPNRKFNAIKLINLDVVIYTYHNLLFGNNCIGVWLADDITLPTAMKRLVNVYHKTKSRTLHKYRYSE